MGLNSRHAIAREGGGRDTAEIDWDLVSNAAITFASTVVGVYLAFYVTERADHRKRMRDSFHAPLAEVMDASLRSLDAWKPLPLDDLDHFQRSSTSMGLMTSGFRSDLNSAEEQFRMYEEHRSHFGTHAEHVLSEELGPLSQAKHAMDTILEVTRGDVRTVREALHDPRSYEPLEPGREWLSAFLAVALETKKVLAPGKKVAPGSAPNGLTATWNDQPYVLESAVETIARRAYERIRGHTIRSMLADARESSRASAALILEKVHAVDRKKSR